MIRPRLVFALLLAVSQGVAHGSVQVVDDAGRPVRLAAPPRRIVSLSPHLTEILFAIGAGDRLVGTVDYSDYPAAAARLPRVGGHQLDLEAIAALRPDLVLAWGSGNPARQVAKLEDLGMPVYYSETGHVAEIPATLERLGKLTGSESIAAKGAAHFREKLAELTKRYRGRPPVRVFVQIEARPLLTVNGRHLINDVLGLCGGQNPFAGLSALTPNLDAEGVLAADPQAIVATAIDGQRPAWLEEWKRWPALSAVRYGNLFFIPEDLLTRASPRILEATAILCEQLETARRHLSLPKQP